ncbi:MAG: hypothetical protein HUK24_00365, partial [Sphaerochaetaceae bacterium]|nr:hypothetical protein [Sphaerochaetaceae bacterium]
MSDRQKIISNALEVLNVGQYIIDNSGVSVEDKENFEFSIKRVICKSFNQIIYGKTFVYYDVDIDFQEKVLDIEASFFYRWAVGYVAYNLVSNKQLKNQISDYMGNLVKECQIKLFMDNGHTRAYFGTWITGLHHGGLQPWFWCKCFSIRPPYNEFIGTCADLEILYKKYQKIILTEAKSLGLNIDYNPLKGDTDSTIEVAPSEQHTEKEQKSSESQYGG